MMGTTNDPIVLQCGDCLELFKSQPADSVLLIMTSLMQNVAKPAMPLTYRKTSYLAVFCASDR